MQSLRQRLPPGQHALQTQNYPHPGTWPPGPTRPVPNTRRLSDGVGERMTKGSPNNPHQGPLSLQGAPSRSTRGGFSRPGPQPHGAHAPLRRKSRINATSAAKPSTAAPRSTHTFASTRAISPSSVNFAAKAFTKKVTCGARPSPHLPSGLGRSPLAGRQRRIQREGAREPQAPAQHFSGIGLCRVWVEALRAGLVDLAGLSLVARGDSEFGRWEGRKEGAEGKEVGERQGIAL